MAGRVFGRTNREFPPVWLSLSVPRSSDELDRLVDAALAADVPLDLSSSPGLWGGHMRGSDRFLTCASNVGYELANSEDHATDLVQAHLIETLSCIGREHWDIYYLRVRRTVEEFQFAGALRALEMARQEGHIRHIGLACDGPGLATLGMWQFNDAFEVLRVPLDSEDDAYGTLAPMARERRVGVLGVARGPKVASSGADAVLVPVSTALEVGEALRG